MKQEKEEELSRIKYARVFYQRKLLRKYVWNTF